METEKTENRFRNIKSYVLRKGRITKGQKSAIERLAPAHLIVPDNVSSVLEKELSCRRQIVAEIGFGNGEATAAIAENNPEILYLAIEVYKPGIGSLLKLIEERKLENIKIVFHDAVEVFESLKGKIIFDGFHIFFPDPWHKKKHKKRRLINRYFTQLLAEMLKPGGYIFTVTDWEDYSRQIISEYESNILLSKADSSISMPCRSGTRFEEKGIVKNHEVFEILYLRNRVAGQA